MVNAQTKNGKFFISGSSRFSSQFIDSKAESNGYSQSYSNTQVSFEPSFGYFFADNVVIGLTSSLTYNKSDDASMSSFLFGPMTRLYLSQSNIKPFLGGQIGMAFENQKYNDSYLTSSMEVKLNGMFYGVELGMAVFMNESVSFDVSAGYSGTSLKYSEDSSMKAKSGGISINLGFSFCL